MRYRYIFKPSLVWYRFRNFLHWEFGLHKLEVIEDINGRMCQWCRICGNHFYWN